MANKRRAKQTGGQSDIGRSDRTATVGPPQPPWRESDARVTTRGAGSVTVMRDRPDREVGSDHDGGASRTVDTETDADEIDLAHSQEIADADTDGEDIGDADAVVDGDGGRAGAEGIGGPDSDGDGAGDGVVNADDDADGADDTDRAVDAAAEEIDEADESDRAVDAADTGTDTESDADGVDPADADGVDPADTESDVEVVDAADTGTDTESDADGVDPADTDTEAEAEADADGMDPADTDTEAEVDVEVVDAADTEAEAEVAVDVDGVPGAEAEVVGVGGEVGGWPGSAGSLVGVGAGRRVLVVRVVLVGVLFVMVAAFAAAGWSQSRAEVYEATAEIRYRAVDDVAFGAADRALASQLAAITTQAVIVPAAAALSVDADELAERVSAALVPDSDVIRVRATAPSPGEAERVLGAVVDQYLERVASEETPVEGSEFLASELGAVDEELAALESALAAEDREPDSAETAQLAARYESLLGYRTTLAERLADLNIELLSERRTDVLASPDADLSPVSPQPARAALVAAMAAGLVALAAATVVLRRPTHPTPVEAT